MRKLREGKYSYSEYSTIGNLVQVLAYLNFDFTDVIVVGHNGFSYENSSSTLSRPTRHRKGRKRQ